MADLQAHIKIEVGKAQEVRFWVRSAVKTNALSYNDVFYNQWENYDQLYNLAEVSGGVLAERLNEQHGDRFDPDEVAEAMRDLMVEYVERMFKDG